jgi:TRAP-type C4-dicarboxylate transport system substrate-binding protein
MTIRTGPPRRGCSLTRAALVALGAAACALALSAPPASAQGKRAKHELKIATLAPEGSTWMNLMSELDRQVREKTQGEVGLRFYPGGIQGDEQVVLRKIRTGQLHGGGFTGVGLGEIAPSLRVMELPFLFRNDEEVRAVHAKMDPVFEEELRSKGFTLLGWAEVGLVYLYSKNPVASAADLKAQKVWLWEGDPLAEAFMKAAGVSAISLSITDVLTSLQTGMISTVYITPLACIAMQWFTRVQYVTDLPVTNSLGAVVVTNEAWDRIPAAQQTVVREFCADYFGRLMTATAADNAKSVDVIRQNGVKSVTPAASELDAFHRIGEQTWQELVGKLYDQATLDAVLSVLTAHRGAAGGR